MNTRIEHRSSSEIESIINEILYSSDPMVRCLMRVKIEKMVKETIDNYLQQHIHQAITDCVEAKLEGLEIKVNL